MPYPILIRVEVFWVRSRFWSVLIEKSNAGFPAVNPAYGCGIYLAIAIWG